MFYRRGQIVGKLSDEGLKQVLNRVSDQTSGAKTTVHVSYRIPLLIYPVWGGSRLIPYPTIDLFSLKRVTWVSVHHYWFIQSYCYTGHLRFRIPLSMYLIFSGHVSYRSPFIDLFFISLPSDWTPGSNVVLHMRRVKLIFNLRKNFKGIFGGVTFIFYFRWRKL